MPVFNKMVYNGTEYILGGGGNIGEPLNLTVTTSGLDATIKWEDNEIGTIPPTTFQKSELVRKIGSAPTSPSDGTLVVTETVKDTYKTTGYVDQGLTDGETYYYRVFSYSNLGGISYCDAVSVTISGGWQPGVNTVLYFPLQSDAVDTIAGVTLTANGTVTYTTPTGVSIPCAYFSSGGWLEKTTSTSELVTGANPRTISGWICSTDSSSRYSVACYGENSSVNTIFDLYYGEGGNGWRFTQAGSGSNYGSTMTINAWHNIVVTYTGTKVIWYIDGVQDQEWTYTINTGNSVMYLGGDMSEGYYAPSTGLKGYLSNVIFENVAWSAQDVSDYYNLTKGDYGIS